MWLSPEDSAITMVILLSLFHFFLAENSSSKYRTFNDDDDCTRDDILPSPLSSVYLNIIM